VSEIAGRLFNYREEYFKWVGEIIGFRSVAKVPRDFQYLLTMGDKQCVGRRHLSRVRVKLPISTSGPEFGWAHFGVTMRGRGTSWNETDGIGPSAVLRSRCTPIPKMMRLLPA
jgi:hypothetical protein